MPCGIIFFNNQKMMQRICPSILKISEQVLEALHHNKPVVALQSTIISHGMPFPQNKQCALSIENKIKEQGAVPATVAIFDGKIHVGLTEKHIQRLAYEGHNGKVRKVSRRDLAYAVAKKQNGATTVSGTMIAAYSAGIDIFVTGGIGGVHRGFQQTMDVSADLQQLARTPVTVVSAGVKSILDIPRTLQYLETKGVPVMTYKSTHFPAFFSSSSGLLSPFTVSSQQEAANIIYSHKQLGLQTGLLLAVPNPKPAQGQQIEAAISQAIKQSKQQNVTGAKITPFLLKRVVELTKGKSLQSNISLVHNNALVGGKVASELSKIKIEARQRATKAFSFSKSMNSFNNQKTKEIQGKQQNVFHQKPKGRIFAIGGSAIDYQLSPKSGNFQMYKSCIGKTKKSLGGIARNIVDCSSKLGIDSILISAIGKDSQGNIISDFCRKHKIGFVPIYPQQNSQNISSGRYYAIMDHNRNQFLGISEMQINEIMTFQNIYEEFLKQQSLISKSDQKRINKDDIVVVESNISQKQLLKVVEFVVSQFGCSIVYEAKGQKAKRIVHSQAMPYINLLKMNHFQKIEIQKALEQKNLLKGTDLETYLATNIGKKHPNDKLHTKCIVTKGGQSIQLLRRTSSGSTKVQHFKVFPISNVQKTTGAGDTFTGAFCSMLLYGKTEEEALKYACAASKINIESPVNQSVISDRINLQILDEVLQNLLKNNNL